MSEQTAASVTGEKHLFRDSKLGLAVAGIGTVALDAALTAALETLTSVDTSSWSGWWTTVASAGLATVVGLVTAYRAKARARALPTRGR
jgi:uncharacterized membrane protein